MKRLTCSGPSCGWALVLLSLAGIPTVSAQQFVSDNGAGAEIAHTPPGFDDLKIGTGAAWADYDNDGDLDLYVTNRTGANSLFLNNGSGVFTNQATALGVEDATHDGAGVTAVDFDNDGDQDLYLANSDEDVLFRNNLSETGTFSFTDITAGSGFEVLDIRRGASASWGDYDQDGFLDVYIAHHEPVAGTVTSQKDALFHNNGDGTFTEVTDLIDGDADNDGVNDLEGKGFIAGWTDFDQDNDLDLYLINDCPFGPENHKVWRNDGGTDALTWNFTEVSTLIGADLCENGMGLANGDYDRDGDSDYFFSNIRSAILERNDGGTLTNVTAAAGVFSDFVPGVTPNLNRITWGVIFLDYDLDQDLDLLVAAGALADNLGLNPQPDILYRNNGDGTFTDVSDQLPLDTRRGRTISMGDYDADGDPDVYLVNYDGASVLLENTNANGNHWLIVDLVGTQSNRDGTGAKVEVETPDGIRQYFETRNGSSLGAGEDKAAYFGLGTQTTISELTITWPSGLVQTLTNVAVDQRLTVTEGETPSITPVFTDVSQTAGVRLTHDGQSLIDAGDMGIGTGAAWLDYDGDGDLDLYFTMRAEANRLWRNNGNGTFTDVAATAGVQDASHDGAGVAVADYDNDGDLDLYLANGDEDILYRNNGDGTFTDVTATAFPGNPAPFLPQRGTSASWGDYDRDGFVDLYVAHHMPLFGDPLLDSQDYLFHNNGDGTFTEVSSLIATDADADGVPDHEGFGFIAAWTDFDGDGDVDLYLMNDCPFGPEDNKLWRNDGGSDPESWSFTEVSDQVGPFTGGKEDPQTGLVKPDCQNAMGIAWADYDHDGDFDYWYSNLDNDSGGQSATLLNNDGGSGGTYFTNVTDDAGMFEDLVPGSDPARGRITWGGVFGDFDRDGREDLAVAAGTINETSSADAQPNLFYQNSGDGTFSNPFSGIENPRRARTIILGDYDNDGDADLFVVNFGEASALYRNDTPSTFNWLIVDLEGTISNTVGIGATVRVTYQGLGGPQGPTATVTQTREVRSGSSLGGGDDTGVYFGFGTTASIDEIAVTWPSGIVQTVTGTALNQRITITEPSPTLTLTSPNGGESWTVGSTQPITWSSTDLSGNVKLDLFQGGILNSTLAASTPNDGSFDWAIPSGQATGSDYTVRISSVDVSGLSDESDAGFTLTADAPFITVVSPNGGESFNTGTVQTITWNDNLAGNVAVVLTQDNLAFKTLAASTESDGSFAWTIGDDIPPGSTYKIRVTSLDDTSLKDNSDAFFTVTAGAPTITVLSPNGGETLDLGQSVTLTWVDNLAGNVHLNLTKNDLLLRTLVANTPSDGTQTVTIPPDLPPASDYKLRVVDAANTSLKDNSDGFFSVVSGATSYVGVLSPNGGETFTMGTTVPITWQSNLGGNVLIRLLQNNVVLRDLVASTPNDGAFDWTIPTDLTPASDYKVRVTSLTNTTIKDNSNTPFTLNAAGGPIAGKVGADVPVVYSLAGAYPNPFNPVTVLRYGLPEASVVRLVVYDVLGRAVARLVEGEQQAGWHEVVFDGSSMPSGVYLVRLEAGTFTQTRSMLLVK